jgi:dTDP-4-dehydrorhamnose reductase
VNPTRVLVTGARGQVGVDLVDTLSGLRPPGADAAWRPDGRGVGEGEFDVVALGRGELDVTDRDRVLTVVRECAPDVVIHLAAYTAVDQAESDAVTCFAVNDEATGTLSDAARDAGAHLITISTDYVFDGTKGEAYEEGDPATPLSVYGASKLAGEFRCRAEDTIVRTSWVMGVRGRNVVHAIADRAARGESVRFVNDQTGTVTVAADLARALVTLARERPGGVWHVANTGAATWYDVACFVGAELGRDQDFATPISTGELDPAPRARRPRRSDLSTARWCSRWQGLPAWRDGVARLVRDRAAP